jgi:hypothetical protein
MEKAYCSGRNMNEGLIVGWCFPSQTQFNQALLRESWIFWNPFIKKESSQL